MKPGSAPACCNTHASSALEVVLPWVPTMTARRRSAMKNRISASGIEQYGIPAASIASISSLPRDIALPTTTRSGRGSRFAARKPSATGISREASSVLIGG